MKRLIEFPTKDGQSIFVEVEDSSDGIGLQRASIKPGELFEKAKENFDNALDRLRPAAEIIIRKLRGLSDPPDEVEVEFGLKITSEVGVVITATEAEAHYTVTLKWKKEKS